MVQLAYRPAYACLLVCTNCLSVPPAFLWYRLPVCATCGTCLRAYLYQMPVWGATWLPVILPAGLPHLPAFSTCLLVPTAWRCYLSTCATCLQCRPVCIVCLSVPPAFGATNFAVVPVCLCRLPVYATCLGVVPTGLCLVPVCPTCMSGVPPACPWCRLPVFATCLSVPICICLPQVNIHVWAF